MSDIYNRQGIWWRYFIPMLIMALLLVIPSVRNTFSAYGLRSVYMLALSFSFSFCLTPLFRWIAPAIGAMDVPDARKNHDEATPLLGGGAFFLSFLMAILVNGIFSQELVAVLTASSLLFVTGLIDDITDVKAGVKLFVQLAAVALVMWQGVMLRVIPESFGAISDISNGSLTILWILGITNAFNFFDGMDGMASGLGVIIAFFLGVVAFQTDQPFLGWIAVAVMGSCLGFLPYNLLKNEGATIFLGDAGSTVIGFILACVAVYGDWNINNTVIAVIAPLLIFWVLIFDMVHITIDRILTGKVSSFRQWLEYVGRDHLHHRLAQVLGGQKRSVFFIYLLTACFGISAVVLRNASTGDAVLLIFQAVCMVIMVTILERIGRKKAECENSVSDPEIAEGAVSLNSEAITD